MINRSVLLWCFVLAAVPAFSAQHGAPRSKSAVVDVGDQDTIREIVDIEHQAREATPAARRGFSSAHARR